MTRKKWKEKRKDRKEVESKKTNSIFLKKKEKEERKKWRTPKYREEWEDDE